MTKKQPREVRVDEIIEAAIEVFLEKGYDGASVEAISRRAGVSKGGFYHHFENKEMLLIQANERLSLPVMEMAKQAYLNPSPIAGLRKYILSYLQYWADKPKEMSFFFLSMSKCLESEVLRAYYKAYYDTTMEFFIGFFQRAMDLGEVQISDAEAYGISLMGALDGLVLYAILNPEQDVQLLADRFDRVWLQKTKDA